MRAPTKPKLLNWGYTASMPSNSLSQHPVATPALWKGTENVLKIGRPEAIVVTVPSGSAGKIKTEISRPDPGGSIHQGPGCWLFEGGAG